MSVRDQLKPRPASIRGSERRGRASAPPPFQRPIEEQGPALLRFCASQAGPERAEDVVQETMLAAWRAYDQMRDTGSLVVVSDRRAQGDRRPRAHARAPQPVADPEPALAAVDNVALVDDSIWVTVRGLPDKRREGVTRRFLADLSHREISAVMQISEAAARRNVSEALKRLQTEPNSHRHRHPDGTS